MVDFFGFCNNPLGALMFYMKQFLLMFVNFVKPILPESAFHSSIESLGGSITPYVGIANYFIDVGVICAIVAAWCGAIAAFYTCQALLRIAKQIKG